MEPYLKNKDTEAECRKQKIIKLLTKVLDKYDAKPTDERAAGEVGPIKRDSFREHYKGIAEKLTEVSMLLPVWEPTKFLPKRDDPCFLRCKRGPGRGSL